MTKRKTTEESEAKAEMIYWATGKTKIYPERNFAKNYNEIKARSKKKRDDKNVSTRFESNSRK